MPALLTSPIGKLMNDWRHRLQRDTERETESKRRRAELFRRTQCKRGVAILMFEHRRFMDAVYDGSTDPDGRI